MSSAHQSPAPSSSRPAKQPTGPLAALLLAAVVAGLAVAADQLIETWADDYLLLAWLLMWAVVFVGSLLLAGTARRVAQRTMERLNHWAQRRAQRRALARMRLMARTDARIRALLQDPHQTSV